MPKKRADRWKNWQPPEKHWWNPDASDDSTQSRREEIAKACCDEKNGMTLAQNIARKVAQRAFWYADKEQAIRDTADDIVGHGYDIAIKTYDPTRGASFKTFLYRVLFSRARLWVRRFKKKQMLYAKNEISVECKGNVLGNSHGDCWEEGVPVRRYTILDFDRFIYSPLLHTNDGQSKQFLESNHDDLIKEQAFTLDDKTMRESIESLRKVRKISDAEFQTIQKRYLPASYRTLGDVKLRKALTLLDVRIFKLAVTINCERRYTKEDIQKILGIKRDFLHARFMAILERLGIPYECADQWYKNHKIFKRKRERKKKADLPPPPDCDTINQEKGWE
jgi:hypothetical protein